MKPTLALLLSAASLFVGACSGGSGSQAPTGAPLSCPQTPAGCVCGGTWDEARASAACQNYADSVWTGTCGGYDFILYGHTDTSETDYYDHQTGQLVAAVGFTASDGKSTCLAGPPTFSEPPGCEQNATEVCGPDLPMDAGAPDGG